MVDLTAKNEKNPLVEFSDLISPEGADGDKGTGVSAPDAIDDPASIRPLSQQAWEQMHPEFTQESDAPENGDVTESSDSTGPGSFTGSGGGAATNPAYDLPAPDFDNTQYGNPRGGNFVSDDADAAEKIVRTARAMLGKPYIWGGEGWGGADCSGLVQLAYAQAGIEMPRLSNYQMAKGKRVNYKDLKPGDLVGWDNSNHVVGADHIAIYIGNNQIIEAPRPGTNIRVSGLYDYDVSEMWAVRIPGRRVAPSAPAAPKAPQPKTSTLSNRALEAQSTAAAAKPKKKKKPKPKTQADVHSTGALAVKN